MLLPYNRVDIFMLPSAHTNAASNIQARASDMGGHDNTEMHIAYNANAELQVRAL